MIRKHLYKQLLRHAGVFAHNDTARQLALARFAEFVPAGVTLSAGGREHPADVIRQSFRYPVDPTNESDNSTSSNPTNNNAAARLNAGFAALKAMTDDEADVALLALWTNLIVPPRKHQDVHLPVDPARPARSSATLLAKRSKPPAPLAPKAMVREMRAFVMVSVILRLAQLHYRAQRLLRDGAQTHEILRLEGSHPSTTHAIHAETKALTDRVQNDIDAFAREVIRRLDERNIQIPASVRCSLSPTWECVLSPPAVGDEARRINQLRPHLETIFSIILDVVLAPATTSPGQQHASAAAAAASEAPAWKPLTVVSTMTPSQTMASASAEDARRALQLHCLSTVLTTREASEAVAAAFVMSVAVRLGLRRTRMVHTRAAVSSVEAGAAASSLEHFDVLVDGPLTNEARDRGPVGPIIINLHHRRVYRADAIPGHSVIPPSGANDPPPATVAAMTSEELPFALPAADRRAAVALLRRMRREHINSVEETRTALATHAGETSDAAVLWLRTATTLPEPAPLPGGHCATALLPTVTAAELAGDTHAAAEQHDQLARLQALSDGDEWRGEEEEVDADDFNAGAHSSTAGHNNDMNTSPASSPQPGTIMPPKVLAAYLCSHLLAAGAGHSLSHDNASIRGAGLSAASSRPRRNAPEPRPAVAPSPAVLADDETWRLLRSQIIFLAQLP